MEKFKLDEDGLYIIKEICKKISSANKDKDVIVSAIRTNADDVRLIYYSYSKRIYKKSSIPNDVYDYIESLLLMNRWENTCYRGGRHSIGFSELKYGNDRIEEKTMNAIAYLIMKTENIDLIRPGLKEK